MTLTAVSPSDGARARSVDQAADPDDAVGTALAAGLDVLGDPLDELPFESEDPFESPLLFSAVVVVFVSAGSFLVSDGLFAPPDPASRESLR
jgi:hypothetical protein